MVIKYSFNDLFLEYVEVVNDLDPKDTFELLKHLLYAYQDVVSKK